MASRAMPITIKPAGHYAPGAFAGATDAVWKIPAEIISLVDAHPDRLRLFVHVVWVGAGAHVVLTSCFDDHVSHPFLVHTVLDPSDRLRWTAALMRTRLEAVFVDLCGRRLLSARCDVRASPAVFALLATGAILPATTSDYLAVAEAADAAFRMRETELDRVDLRIVAIRSRGAPETDDDSGPSYLHCRPGNPRGQVWRIPGPGNFGSDLEVDVATLLARIFEPFDVLLNPNQRSGGELCDVLAIAEHGYLVVECKKRQQSIVGRGDDIPAIQKRLHGRAKKGLKQMNRALKIAEKGPIDVLLPHDDLRERLVSREKLGALPFRLEHGCARIDVASRKAHILVVLNDMYCDSYQTTGVEALALMAACGRDVLVMGLHDLLEMVSASPDAEIFLARFALQARHARESGSMLRHRHHR